MRVSRGMIVRLSLVMAATASPLMAQDTVVVDLSALSRRARIEALNDPSLVKDVRAFDDRSRRRKGVFIGPEQLDKLAPLLFQDIIAGRNDAVIVDQEQKLMLRTLNERVVAPWPPEPKITVDRNSPVSMRGSTPALVAVEIY